MSSIQHFLAQAKSKISPLDAEVLLAHVLQKSRTYLYAFPQKALDSQSQSEFLNLIQRRIAGVPVAYLIGSKEFWSLSFTVSSDTLIPRPETELLVEEILKQLPQKHLKIADLGTGSGAIACALAKERPEWEIVATDISHEALTIASNNAQRFGLENISFYQGSWFTALPDTDFDVIVSNPPYIAEAEWASYEAGLRYEPKGALISGFDGLKDLRNIIFLAKNYLKKHGHVVVEHGCNQGKEVRNLCFEANLKDVKTFQDYANLDRFTMGTA